MLGDETTGKFDPLSGVVGHAIDRCISLTKSSVAIIISTPVSHSYMNWCIVLMVAKSGTGEGCLKKA